MSAILIIPAYREEVRLPAVLADVAAAVPDFDVVVVDDGSPDDTSAVAAGAGATVIRHPFNLGYGAALQTGYKYAWAREASVVVQMDADGQHRASDIPNLLAPIRDGELDLVVGSRFLESSGYHMGWVRSLGRDFFRGTARLAGLRVTDPTSGFQALNRRVLEIYRGDFFPTDYPDVDVLLAAHRCGLRIGERPVHMHESVRASTMHGGLRSFYYVYKMLLSSWSASPRPSAAARPQEATER